MNKFADRAKPRKEAATLTRRALQERVPGWGVSVLESHHAPAFVMEWRTHPFLKVVYVLQGSGTFFLGEHPSPFGPGDVVVVPPGTRNRLEDDPADASSLYVCCIAVEHFRFESGLADRFRAAVLSQDGHFSQRVAAIMRRLTHLQSGLKSRRAIAMVADALRLSELVLDQTEKRQRFDADLADPSLAMADYLTRLGEHFFEATTIDAAAASVNLPRRTFTRLFAEATGETWLRFVRRLAIEHAKRLLRETELPIASVAFECGFNDLSTFYRQFKSRCGESPARFRESQR